MSTFRFVLVFLVSIASLLTIGCSAQASTPQPTPVVISDTYSSLANSGKPAQCLRINTQLIWSEGAEADTLHDRIRDSLVLSVNGRAVNEGVETWTQGGLVFPQTDEEGNVIGSYPGSVSACFSVEWLASGTYLAAVTFSNLANTRYAHSWEFEIERTPAPTPQSG